LKYISVKFRSAVPRREPMGTGIHVRDFLNDWTQSQRDKAPVSAFGPFYSAGMFIWYDISQELIAGLFSGCAIAGPVAFVVLLFATRNVLIAFYAVFCVGAVVMCVLGFCKSAMDYSLGIGESIAGVIVIGLSVDYCVHLAHMYVESSQYGKTTREERATFAVKNMGVTVFAGAVTTAGAALIMFACFSTFFHKMAILMSMTIFFSLLFSMGMFMSLLFLIGPEGNCGDLNFLCRSCKKDSNSNSGSDTKKDSNSNSGSDTSSHRTVVIA
jgi:predicted RND superfamily exporter protein